MADHLLSKGVYRARIAAGRGDVGAAQALRYLAFRDPEGEGRDVDRYDGMNRHLLVEGPEGLVCTFRYQIFPGAADTRIGYSAGVYDLSHLSALDGPMIEMGRFCLHPKAHDPDILRLAWAAMTRLVDEAQAVLLFGCSSFRGTDPAPYTDALRMLAAEHIAPARIRPGPKARERMALPEGPYDPQSAQRQLPPLLRTYMLMGGWVSDHAVIDRVMNTLHVFTGVEIDRVPEARARALRALAQE
ncbi:GNAT family N-acetyltransferase [Maritimibacter sp. DP1N21-5]|uniref:GNAT family N-acetyltransferase n=1 Tax=Maritimibacter sp. DP1N21-5 TaxID=2836867 RepID=UPI001C46F360|nr:GNAT family N-acetyltransferase [Maritimibacter sp. DP1N21-5]MBV7409553.1 GNAT family N-acetyltransferase [Maritimibacter sp. DP1N21-5]